MSVQKTLDDLSLSAVCLASPDTPLWETLPLPQGCAGRVWYHTNPSKSVRPHRHAELEVNLVTRGTASYLVQNTRLDLKPGTLLWLFPNQDHVLLNKSPDFEMWIVVWTPDFTTSWCGKDAAPAQINAPPRFFCRLREPEKAHFDGVLRDVSHAFGDPSRCNAGLAYLLLSLWRAHETAQTEAAPAQSIHPAVEKTVRLLRDETDPLSVEHMAALSGISSGRLSHLFRAQTGQSIAAFRNRQRVERFLRIYQTPANAHSPSPTLLDAALQAGFGSYAQFFRVFRSVVGCAPAAYFR